MTTESWKIFRIITILIAITSVWVDWRFTTGFLLGTIESAIQYKRNEVYWTNILRLGFAKRGTGSGNFMVHYMMITAVLLIGALLPAYFNIFGCTLGMLMIKITIVIESLLKHRKGLS